eukprot:XP_001691705.1 ligand-gated ion channel [Chlamydomonas reinhardtii]
MPNYAALLSECSQNIKCTLLLAGNREYYANGATMAEVDAQIDLLCCALGNVHYLNNRELRLGGITFVGSTLWSYIPPEQADAMSDMLCFCGCHSCRDAGDPHRGHRRRRQWPQPALQLSVGGTRVVTNQYGYQKGRPLRRFRPGLLLEGMTRPALSGRQGQGGGAGGGVAAAAGPDDVHVRVTRAHYAEPAAGAGVAGVAGRQGGGRKLSPFERMQLGGQQAAGRGGGDVVDSVAGSGETAAEQVAAGGGHTSGAGRDGAAEEDGSVSGESEGGYTDVAVSALLERVTAFSTSENTYHAAWWVILTWKDAGAGEAVRARSAQVMNNASDVCARSCDSNGLPSAGCCDAMWLPHIEMPNLIGYDEDQLPRYRINANATSGAVSWSTRIIGRWYSPLDFRAYPFDHQHLLMEMAIADSQSHAVGLKWEHVAKLNNTAHTKGADLSGWRVKWGKGKLYDSRTCQASYGVTAHRYYDASSASSGELAVLVQSLRVTDRHYADNSGRGTTAPDWCGTYSSVYDEARALYGPIVLVADIMVKRVSSYYVMANLIPVLIISLVVFVVYCMPCNALGDRMVVIMTLFLSLTAMQFVFDFPPANYLNALQQVVLVAYVMMLVACVESLIVNRIATLPVVLTNKRTCFQKRQTNASAGGSGTLTRRVSRALTSAFTKFRDMAVAMGSRPPSVTAPAPLPTPSHAAAAAALQPAAASPKADPNANPAGFGSIGGPAGSCSRNGGDMLDPVAYGGTASVHLAPLTGSHFAPVAAVGDHKMMLGDRPGNM